jgi:hypothetical protein
VWCGLERGIHNGDDFASTFRAELDLTRGKSEECVIVSATDVGTGVEVGSTLANEDFASLDDLTTEALHTEVLSVRVATVSGRGRTFFMCHEFPLTSW